MNCGSFQIGRSATRLNVVFTIKSREPSLNYFQKSSIQRKFYSIFAIYYL